MSDKARDESKADAKKEYLMKLMKKAEEIAQKAKDDPELEKRIKERCRF